MMEAHMTPDGLRFVNALGMAFLRGPIADPPPSADSLIMTVDAGTLLRPGKYIPALYEEGEWRKFPSGELGIEPTHWTVYVGQEKITR